MNSSLSLRHRSHFSELLLTMEHDFGTRATCLDVLDCLQASLTATDFADADDLRRQFVEFYDIYLHLKPRMAIIQHYLDSILKTLADHRADDLPTLRATMLASIDSAERHVRESSQQLTAQAVRLITNGCRILLHSHSHSVLDALIRAKQLHKKFDVIVAEQEANRTLEVIGILKEHDIPFVVVPEYMLSCVEHDVSFAILGAVTLKYNDVLVVDAGTKAIVSELNSAKIPVYLLLSNNRFSYWKTRDAQQTVKSVKTLMHKKGSFAYDRIKFSHDRLPIDQVTKIITETGVHTPAEIRTLHADRVQQYRQSMQEYSTSMGFDLTE